MLQRLGIEHPQKTARHVCHSRLHAALPFAQSHSGAAVRNKLLWRVCGECAPAWSLCSEPPEPFTRRWSPDQRRVDITRMVSTISGRKLPLQGQVAPSFWRVLEEWRGARSSEHRQVRTQVQVVTSMQRILRCTQTIAGRITSRGMHLKRRSFAYTKIYLRP